MKMFKIQHDFYEQIMGSIFLRTRRLKRFKIKKSSRILDLGCGEGINILALKKMGVNNIVGLDISQLLLKEAKTKNPDMKFVLASAEDLPFKNNQFDIVLVSGVFHHLLNYDKALKEIWRVLDTNGYLCFIEPHASLGRTMLDYFTVNAASVSKSRRKYYSQEHDLMQNWLNYEYKFMQLLNTLGFTKIFLQYDLLSSIGKYQKRIKKE